MIGFQSDLQKNWIWADSLNKAFKVRNRLLVVKFKFRLLLSIPVSAFFCLLFFFICEDPTWQSARTSLLVRLWSVRSHQCDLNIQTCVHAAADLNVWNSFTNSLFNHTVSLFLCYKHSNNHRSTGIKVYSSDINSDVYGSDQNRVNHLLEVIWYFK